MIERRILRCWEECIGLLNCLDHDGDSLVAKVGPVVVLLPPELEGELRSHVGEKVGVLKTDDPSRSYRVRSWPAP